MQNQTLLFEKKNTLSCECMKSKHARKELIHFKWLVNKMNRENIFQPHSISFVVCNVESVYSRRNIMK